MRDIARGGIRLIKSHNLEAYVQNVSTVFQENYNLASTQDRKNKDIPEGGSKGTVLLSVEHQDKGFEAFTKYIDSLIDLLLPEQQGMVDLFGKQEVHFCSDHSNNSRFFSLDPMRTPLTTWIGRRNMPRREDTSSGRLSRPENRPSLEESLTICTA